MCLCVCVFVCLCCVRCYRFNIDLVTGCREIDAELPFVCKNIFCVYTFNEKEYNTKNIGNTKLPCFDYSQVHAVQTVNETFIQTIQTRPFRVHIYVTKEQEHGNGEEEGETKEQEAAVRARANVTLRGCKGPRAALFRIEPRLRVPAPSCHPYLRLRPSWRRFSRHCSSLASL